LSLTLREEQRLRIFQTWVLRTIFGPKREEVRACWKGLYNVERHITGAIQEIVMGGQDARIGERERERGEMHVRFTCKI
jgi:hypothetical protein